MEGGSAYRQDHMLPWEDSSLLEVEVIVEVLVNRLQLLQHTTFRVAAKVLDGQSMSWVKI